MTKGELELLERAFSAEVSAAISGAPYVIQPRGKLVAKMVDEGLLKEATETWRGITIKGFALTELGRMTYCMTCD